MKNLVIPKQRIAEHAALTPHDRARINQCRRNHNRLGFAYQMAFIRLTGRFPLQLPLEIAEEIVGFVANELHLAPEAIAPNLSCTILRIPLCVDGFNVACSKGNNFMR